MLLISVDSSCIFKHCETNEDDIFALAGIYANFWFSSFFSFRVGSSEE